MKVIPINEREDAGAGGSSRRSQLLRMVRNAAMAALLDAFKQMLEQADDLLFEFAEKSESNAQQNLYFDAMRELRVKRAPMLSAFQEGLASGFEKRRCKAMPVKAAPAASPSTLSLVDDAAMEEDLTIASLVEKMGNCAREELFGLNRRMAELMEVAELDSDGNPLGPRCIAEAARDAAAELTVDLRVRLIVLKLFDRHVASNVASIYAALNQRLVAHGVLPVIHTGVTKQQGAGGWRGGRAASGVQSSPVEMLEMLERLLHSGSGGTGGMSPVVPAAVLDTAALAALTRLQRVAMVPNEDSTDVRSLRELRSSGAMPVLGPSGDMTIDIVAMLFEYILEDRNVPEAIRAKLARLQIPVLKVALIDREFFSRKSHPARRLLNAIAEAALQTAGDPAMESAIAEVVEKVVHRIVSEFEHDLGLFTESVTALESALAELKRESKVRAARTAKLLDGRARMEHAKEYVRDLLDTRLRPEGIPETVRSFLLTHWKHLLISVYVKEGEDSQTLRKGIRVMDELVWSSLPKATAAERDKLTGMLPTLLAHLKKGMEYVSMPNVARSSFLTKLAKVHADAMRTELSAKPVPQHQVPSATPPRENRERGLGMEQGTAAEHDEVLDITTGEIGGAPTVGMRSASDAASAPMAVSLVEGPAGADEALVTAARTPALDPRKKAVLAAIIDHVHRAHGLSPRAGRTQAQARVPPRPKADVMALAQTESDSIYKQCSMEASGQKDRSTGHESVDAGHDSAQAGDAQPQTSEEVASCNAVTPTSLEILEQTKSAAEQLRSRLVSQDEVKLADVLPPLGELPRMSDHAPPAEDSVLDITANTFYRMFSTGETNRGGAGSSLTFEELTLGDTTNPVVRQQDDEHFLKVKNLEPGTWLEFRREDGSTFRARFTWYCAQTDTYLFSDRNGRKLTDRTRNGLVTEFRRGTAKIAQDAPLLDRAFTRLMDRLNLG